MNSLHIPANQEMDRAFDDFAQDPEAWVAILTGAGDKAFSAGNDLKWQAQHGADALLKGLGALRGGFGGVARRFDCFKPIIAAVNGLALGGGFEMALACDIIVAAETAVFGLPEPRVGLLAGAGGIQRLPIKAPFQMAMGMILTGESISAQEAHRLGIVNEVVPTGEALPAAEKWAAKILECAPLAVRASKEGALLANERSLRDIVGQTFPGLTAVFQSEDVIEGSKAFAEKRKPQWKGK
ncbi:MAG: enoyl-CoA hydratase-related protein, partial [Thermodesulfobacteriota bacterium]|nr:enoyl-CoA hydratase-related protein [Thermodesulfobacteriota bacterium]